MLANNDVPSTMARVATAIHRAARSRPRRSVVFITDATTDDIGIASLRRSADVQVEFHSGSTRPYVGRAVIFSKRVVRRGLRWYVGAIVAQQNRFNNASLDVDQRLLARQEELAAQVEDLREAVSQLAAASTGTGQVAPVPLDEPIERTR